MAPKRNPMREIEQRKSAREYETWAASKGANWAQAYKMASPDIRKGMMSRRLDEKARQKAVIAEQKAGIANRFGHQQRRT